MVEGIPTADDQYFMYINGDGGDTGIYQNNLQELGLFQDVDPSKVFDLKDTTEFSMDSMM